MKAEKKIENIDVNLCRRYWTEQTRQAYDFLQGTLAWPVKECDERMVSLRQAVKSARLTVIFSTSKFAGKFEKIFFLREGLIAPFLDAAREINNRGWFIKVEDAYRSGSMQQYFGVQNFILDSVLKKIIWANDGKLPSPETVTHCLSAFAAACPGSSTHMSGGTLDISVCSAGSLCELDRGCKYQEISENIFLDPPYLSVKARKNRREIRNIMEKHGFANYAYGIWQFNSGNACAEKLFNSGKTARYGAINFNPANDSMTAIENPAAPLNQPAHVQEKIESVLKRLKLKF
ncbi:MAG: M15 family metallopeptidase [Victivallales bacterium]|nr:M15 family metallopeptidase [Victivallales bacterium]